MQINYAKSAIIDLQSLPKDVQKRIVQKTRFYAETINPLRFAERLTDHKDAQARFGVGEYRIMFDIINNNIFVLKIKHRKDIYK